MRPRLARKPKIWRAALLLALALPAAPALAAQTATVRGTPALHNGPGTEFAATGKTLPAGATVTVEGCDSGPGAGAWCLVRGAGWVAAEGLVDLSADPLSLLQEGSDLDPLAALGDAGPAWDDPTRDFDDPAD